MTISEVGTTGDAPGPTLAAAGPALIRAAQDFATSPEGRETAAAGAMDWLLLGLAALAVAVVFVLCAKYFLRPGETSENHIKRRILRDEVERESSR